MHVINFAEAAPNFRRVYPTAPRERQRGLLENTILVVVLDVPVVVLDVPDDYSSSPPP